ncbi:hypothetical protein [Priestia megaterium]|uniref:hypothetical protein n=1 Tax=Priestia megaterium TaxID=1404 RepID=UPI00077D9209|nr:hypothetical protein [Priestia megaterium]
MSSYYRNLNRHETYVTTKKQLKKYISPLTDVDFLFGLTRCFEWGSRRFNHPELKGTVVAVASFYRDRSLNLSSFPIVRNVYPEAAYEEFNRNILLTIQRWVCEQLEKPDTAIVGIEQLIVEWEGNKHLLHDVTFLH